MIKFAYFFKMLPNDYMTTEQRYKCDKCFEVIINPICPTCLTIEVEAWLTLYPNLRSKIIPKLKDFLWKIPGGIDNSIKCIKCDDKRASLCPHCFKEFVLRKLHEINANNFVLNEFLEFFNYRSGFRFEALKG